MIYYLCFILLVALFLYFYCIRRNKNEEYKCDINKSENGAFCITKQHPHTGWNYILDLGLATEIGNIFKNKTIIDLGAGLGQYCDVIRNYTTCEAYDGAKNVEIVTQGKVKYLNLAKRIEFNCIHDVVLSIEVGEHIPKYYENVFEDNLIKCSKSIIILTWAKIGQGGFNHVNEKERNDVIKKFISKGLKWNSSIYNMLFKSSKINYIKNNLMVFSK